MQLIPLILLCFSILTSEAAILQGTINDKETREPLIGANIILVGTMAGATTDLDGNFAVRNVEAGTYLAKASMIGYTPVQQEIKVSDGDTIVLTIALISEALEFDEVVIEGTAEKGTAKRELDERMSSVIITDAVSSENMKRAPDPNVASAVRRATGVSTMDGDPVIRGLDARYSKVSLNNSFVSGTEPNRSAVSLELFPSSMMSQLTVNKSYTADQFGEFAAGTVNMDTWSALGEDNLTAGVSSGYNSQTTGRTFHGYSGGNLDFLGFDDGTRSLPSLIEHASSKITLRGQFSNTGYTAQELETISESFPNSWNTTEGTAAPSQSFNWSLSRSSSLMSKPMDYSISSIYNHSFSYKNAVRNIYKGGTNGDIELQHSYDFDHYNEAVNLGGMGAFRWQLSPLSKVNYQILVNRKLDDETRFFSGWNDDRGMNLRDTRLRFVSQTTFTNQVSGNHWLPAVKNSLLDWRVNYSLGTRYEPDTREIQYEANPQSNVYSFADETQSGSRTWNDLTDNTLSGAVDWRLRPWSGNNIGLKTGLAAVTRWRDSQTRFFQFEPTSFSDIDFTQAPEELFSPDNIRPDGFLVREATRPTDSYEASQNIAAYYLTAETPLTRKLHLSAGARLEHSEQAVESYELFTASQTPVRGEITTTDLLPAVSFMYRLRQNANLRLAASQTVSRPDFRELSEFEFTDIIGGHAVVGNPNLKRALIRNLDLRWEWLRGGRDLIAISTFYKQFSNPIEVTIQPTAQNRVTYENAKSADNVGVEFEIREHLDEIHSTLAPFSVNMNLSLIESDIQLSDSSKGIQTSSNRPLHGQSPYLLNVGIGYENGRWNTQADLFLHTFGKRISEVGSKPLPDIYEMPHPDLDFSLRQPLSSAVSVRATLENILDPEVRYEQGGKVTESYRTGRTIAFGISYSH